MNSKFLLRCAALLAPIMVHGASLDIDIDDRAVRAVLKAVTNPALTRDEAMAVARLPGNEGIIAKIRSYHITADEGTLADALVAAAEGKIAPPEDVYQFIGVRDNAERIAHTLEQLDDPSLHLIDQVKVRIARFTPTQVHGRVSGYLIAGGPAGGFSFGKPEFFLNLARYPSPLIAQTILEHELYHGLQGLARVDSPQNKVKACLAKLSGGAHLAEFLIDLYDEGTATYVGDVLSLPIGDDPITEEQRKHLESNIAMLKRSATILDLSVHGIVSSKINFEQIYALGFYGDEFLYALGYIMTKAIDAERGSQAVADLMGAPASGFITTYVALARYGSNKEPRLGDETVAWAKKAQACGA